MRTMKITLYRNMSDNRVVTKDIKKIATVDCQIKESTDRETPTFIINETTIDKNWSSVNYLLSTDLGRYYYVDSPVMGTGGVAYLPCKVDVLMSFKNYIRNSNAIISRQENLSTPYVIDEMLPSTLQRNISLYNFSDTPFKAENVTDGSYCIFLTVTGGTE